MMLNTFSWAHLTRVYVLGEVSIHIYAQVLIGLFVFSLLSIKSSLYVLNNNPYQMSFANIFSLSVAHLFILLTGSFPK